MTEEKEKLERLIADIPQNLKWDLEERAIEESRKRGRKITIRELVIEALEKLLKEGNANLSLAV